MVMMGALRSSHQHPGPHRNGGTPQNLQVAATAAAVSAETLGALLRPVTRGLEPVTKAGQPPRPHHRRPLPFARGALALSPAERPTSPVEVTPTRGSADSPAAAALLPRGWTPYSPPDFLFSSVSRCLSRLRPTSPSTASLEGGVQPSMRRLLSSRQTQRPPHDAGDHHDDEASKELGRVSDSLLRATLDPKLALNAAVDRSLLLSRERLNMASRQALHRRAMTPADIRMWQSEVPLSSVREELRRRRLQRPPEELLKDLRDDAVRDVQQYLNTEVGIKHLSAPGFNATMSDAMDGAALAATPSPHQTSPSKRLQKRLVRSVLSEATLELPDAEEVAKVSTSEACDIANWWARVDELGIGVVNVVDVEAWSRRVFRCPIDEEYASWVLEHESGMVDLQKFCRLLRPGQSNSDGAFFMAVQVASGLVAMPTVTKKVNKAAQQQQSSSHHLAARGRLLHVASLRSTKSSASLTPAVHDEASGHLVRGPPRPAPTFVDRRRWIALADSGLVANLRDMYLRYRDAPQGISFKSFVKRFGRLLPESELSATFLAADRDADGYLCFEEFARCMWPGLCPGSAFPEPAVGGHIASSAVAQ